MLAPLFKLDPLSRRTFLLVVPLRQYGKIASSGQFAPVEIYTTLARYLSEQSYIPEEEVHFGFICICVIYSCPRLIETCFCLELVRTRFIVGDLESLANVTLVINPLYVACFSISLWGFNFTYFIVIYLFEGNIKARDTVNIKPDCKTVCSKEVHGTELFYSQCSWLRLFYCGLHEYESSVNHLFFFKEPLLNVVTVNMARFLRHVGERVNDGKKENHSPPRTLCAQFVCSIGVNCFYIEYCS